ANTIAGRPSSDAAPPTDSSAHDPSRSKPFDTHTRSAEAGEPHARERSAVAPGRPRRAAQTAPAPEDGDAAAPLQPPHGAHLQLVGQAIRPLQPIPASTQPRSTGRASVPLLARHQAQR